MSLQSLSPSRTCCAVVGAIFDDPNLIGSAGLVPIMQLARRAGLHTLTDDYLSVPSDKDANAGAKVTSVVSGMVAGADSIDDMALMRHGAMGKVFNDVRAPSTLGSFLRAFTFGHVRQLDAVATRLLNNLCDTIPMLGGPHKEPVLVDIDNTIVEVHKPSKQGAGFGYSGVRGLNVLLATVSTSHAAPVIVAQRLRRGASASARGAARLVADALATLNHLPGNDVAGRILLRADSATEPSRDPDVFDEQAQRLLFLRCRPGPR